MDLIIAWHLLPLFKNFQRLLTFLLLASTLANCGLKTEPQPILRPSPTQTTSIAEPLKGHYIGDDLLITIAKNDYQSGTLEIWRSFIPENCDPCLFQEELLAKIYQNMPSKYFVANNNDYWLGDSLITEEKNLVLTLQNIDLDNFPYLLVSYQNLSGIKISKSVFVPPKPEFRAPIIHSAYHSEIDAEGYFLQIKWEPLPNKSLNLAFPSLSEVNYVDIVFYHAKEKSIYLTTDAALGKVFLRLPRRAEKGSFYAQFVDSYGNKSLNSKFFP